LSLAVEAISSQIGRNIYLVNEVNQIIFKDKILNLNFRLEVSFAKEVYFLQIENQQGIISMYLIRL